MSESITPSRNWNMDEIRRLVTPDDADIIATISPLVYLMKMINGCSNIRGVRHILLRVVTNLL